VPVDGGNPLPFASCFVCSGTGHLASGCPQNAARGIYPNGGGCKLCGKNTHLAKDCDVRRRGADPRSTGVSFGGGEAGADEDDFHAERRQPAQPPRAVPVPPSNAKKRVVHF
jgi:zinc finger CCHC domain-containing protein 9